VSRIWVNESRLNYLCQQTWRIYMCDSFTCVTRFIHMCAMNWMNRVTHVNESCHIYKRVVSHIWMNDTLIHMCIWIIHMCSFICVTWLVHMCAMSHSYVWHDLFKCVPWLIYMYNMTRSHVCHVLFICVIWLIHMYAMTHSWVWHDSFICGRTPLHYLCDITHVWHDTHSYVW